MTLTDATLLVAAGDLLTTEFGPEIVILDLRDGMYYSLEDAGARIWQLLQQPNSIQAIADAIVGEFDVDSAACAADVRALIETLTGRGLVRAVHQE